MDSFIIDQRASRDLNELIMAVSQLPHLNICVRSRFFGSHKDSAASLFYKFGRLQFHRFILMVIGYDFEVREEMAVCFGTWLYF